MPDLTGFEPEERLTYAIGDIQRADVFAEDEARAVFNVLCAPGLGGATAPRDFARILEGCREMVRVSSLPDYPRDIAMTVLDVAKTAHGARNRLVHDRWVQDRPDLDRWASMRQPRPGAKAPTQRTFAEFEKCRNDVWRAGWRLRALWVILPAWLGHTTTPAGVRTNLDLWTSVALDSFEPAGLDGISITNLPRSQSRNPLDPDPDAADE